jgi:hypothetical protein
MHIDLLFKVLPLTDAFINYLGYSILYADSIFCFYIFHRLVMYVLYYSIYKQLELVLEMFFFFCFDQENIFLYKREIWIQNFLG